MDRFLVDFGVPEGTQKLLKISEGFWVKRGLGSHRVATLAGSAHFFRFWLDFLSILVPFCVTQAPFSNDFGSFLFFLEGLLTGVVLCKLPNPTLYWTG